MPPPRGSWNPLEGPADYDMTSVIHNDTYPAIDPVKADFSGKAIFISGASRGLGRAIAVSFAKAGASMIAMGARTGLSATTRMAREAASQAGKPPPRILPLELDVSDQKGVDEAARRVRDEFGRLDVLINNAGLLGSDNIADSNPDEWARIWRVNLMGPYLLMRAFIPLMLEEGDKTIVNVSSVGALLHTPGVSAYQTSKLAVLRLAEFVCAEYGDKGVLSYCIHPGNMPTDMITGAGTSPELAKVFVDTPELAADSLVYLTSDKKDWLAGRYINVTWDLPELMAKKGEIVAGGKLKVRLVV